jgi:hypothetical protein
LEAAPGPDAKPVPIAQLSKMAGYGCGQYFYAAVHWLVEKGYLTRTKGVRRAA